MEAIKKKQAWSRGDRLLMVTVGLAAVLGGGGVLLSRHLDDTPFVSVPSPTMSTPNAFLYIVAAGALAHESVMAGGKSKDGNLDQLTLPEQAALSRSNAAAFRTLHQGFAFPYQEPPARSFSAVFPQYAKTRHLARALAMDARYQQARGNWAGAMDRSLDAVQLGATIPRGGLLIGMLVGAACEAIGRNRAWGAVPHLTGPQAEAAARRLERIRAQAVPFADTLQQEEWYGQASLEEVFRKPGWRGELASLTRTNSNGAPSRAVAMQLWFTSKRAILDGYTRYMDWSIANARRSYAAHPPVPPMPSDPINQVMLPVFDGARMRETFNAAEDALLMTALALRAYRQDRGAYPTTLASLVPTYLRSVPEDSFALSGPLHYRRSGAAYVLYSIGPDGVDDGGRPIFDPAKPPPIRPGSPDPRYQVTESSRGDIVAGVNLP